MQIWSRYLIYLQDLPFLLSCYNKILIILESKLVLQSIKWIFIWCNWVSLWCIWVWFHFSKLFSFKYSTNFGILWTIIIIKCFLLHYIFVFIKSRRKELFSETVGVCAFRLLFWSSCKELSLKNEYKCLLSFCIMQYSIETLFPKWLLSTHFYLNLFIFCALIEREKREIYVLKITFKFTHYIIKMMILKKLVK